MHKNALINLIWSRILIMFFFAINKFSKITIKFIFLITSNIVTDGIYLSHRRTSLF